MSFGPPRCPNPTCIRHEQPSRDRIIRGRLRRRSWLLSKLARWIDGQLAIFTVFRNYVRQRFNRDEPDQTPAKLLGLIPRKLQPFKVLRWRQDWGSLSVHPMSLCGDRAITQGVSM